MKPDAQSTQVKGCFEYNRGFHPRQQLCSHLLIPSPCPSGMEKRIGELGVKKNKKVKLVD